MKKKDNNGEDIDIRLKLSSKDDQELYEFFSKMKTNLGIKTNTEVARVCIKKAYECWFSKKLES